MENVNDKINDVVTKLSVQTQKNKNFKDQIENLELGE